MSEKKTAYRLEYASSARAKCKGPKPCQGTAITKGALRVGTLVDVRGNSSWTWRHWGCTTEKLIQNWKGVHSSANDMDGYDELNDEDKERVNAAFDAGHVKEADIPESAKKDKGGDGAAPSGRTMPPTQLKKGKKCSLSPIPASAPPIPRPPPHPPSSTSEPFTGVHLEDDDALKEYTKHRRELLEILNGLHSLGLQNDLDLPQIVVVGSQSAGKSSLIESMSGISLPRAAGTCTRCPMECRLLYDPVWSCKISLRFHYDDEKKERLREVREQQFGPTLFNKADVEKTIRAAQQAILRPSFDPRFFLKGEDLVSEGYLASPLSFSANCVCVRVEGPNVPDLYFFDLPGIIANVRDGENIQDIAAVEDIAKTYIARPNCLVLLVISCETDFENQGAGRLVLKDPKLRSRTIGVLTKPDRIEPGTASKWISMLKNTENSLEKGWFAVKQPNALEHQSGISWERGRAEEDAFFTSNEPWMSLERRDRVRLGSVHLAERLSIILSDLVSQKLPQIQVEISRLLTKTAKELAGLPIPDHPDPRQKVVTLLREFARQVSKHIEGLPPTRAEVPKATAALMYKVNHAYDQFRHHVHRTAPQLRPWTQRYHLQNEVPRPRRQIDTPQDASIPTDLPGILWESQMVPEPRAPKQKRQPTSPAISSSYAAMLASAAQDDAHNRQGYVMYVDQVLDLAKRSRTRELPGNFPFSVKENLINDATTDWARLAQECFEHVRSIVTTHMDHLLQEHFGRYTHGGMFEVVSTTLHSLLLDQAEVTKTNVEALCVNESLPFTQNEQYFFAERLKFLNRYRMLYRESQGKTGLINSLESFNLSEPDHHARQQTFWDDINTVLSKLANQGIHGLIASDLAKLLPDDDMSPALEIMAEVRAYFQVAYRRISDIIPQQIDTDFLRKVAISLDVKLMCMDLSTGQCTKWLEESPEIVKMRADLLAKTKRLENARAKLSEYTISSSLPSQNPTAVISLTDEEGERERDSSLLIDEAFPL